MLEIGISVTCICIRADSVVADGEHRCGIGISRRRDQRLPEGERGRPMAIFALTEYAREVAGI